MWKEPVCLILLVAQIQDGRLNNLLKFQHRHCICRLLGQMSQVKSITSVVISILQQRQQQQLHSVISIKFHAYTGHYYARLRSAAKCGDGSVLQISATHHHVASRSPIIVTRLCASLSYSLLTRQLNRRRQYRRRSVCVWWFTAIIQYKITS